MRIDRGWVLARVNKVITESWYELLAFMPEGSGFECFVIRLPQTEMRGPVVDEKDTGRFHIGRIDNTGLGDRKLI